MDNNLSCILQVNTQDCTGGAAHIARNIFRGLEKKGYRSYFAVGIKESNNPSVFLIPNDQNRNRIARLFLSIGSTVKKIPLMHSMGTGLEFVGQSDKFSAYLNGFEDFDFPGTWIISAITPNCSPDIIHCHNLHGGYFDLRCLPAISKKIPTILTLHDAWLLSGHCAHSFGCEKWKNGCGDCPDLTIYPAIRKDATAKNWKKKQEILSEGRLYISTPCQWLMDKVNASLIKPAIIESRVIPNGTDLSIYRPSDKYTAREELGLPQESYIILFAANGIRKNPWKDYQTLRSAINIVFNNNPKNKILFLALGERASSEKIGNARIDFIPYQKDPIKVSRYYQAADIYVHAARADTFPNTIIEALACGLPVVATSVGGIPEQIEVGKTGYLVPAGDATKLAEKVQVLLENESHRQYMGKNGTKIAQERYDANKQVDEYLLWYEKILR